MVELEQLVISILDDPSVSRVMREAGFSSSEVKANLEKAAALSSEQQPSNNTSSSSGASPNPNPKPRPSARLDVAGDAARVMDCMAIGGKRCVVVVGETAEGVVRAVMDRVSKGELPRDHACLRNLQFVPFSAASFRRMAREEAEARVADMRALVRSGCAAGKGVVLVLEDIALAAEAWAAASSNRSGHHHYCPVEHAVMELSSLVRAGGDRFWLLSFGSHLTYTSCKAGVPSLEAVLQLHPVVVPDGSLALSLAGDSDVTRRVSDTVTPMMAAAAGPVPAWPGRYQCPVPSELTLSFSSPTATSPAASSISGFTHCDATHRLHDVFDLRQRWPHRRPEGPKAGESYNDHRQLLADLNHGSSSSTSASNSTDGATELASPGRRPRFTELTAKNLKVLCDALEARVPRHKDVVPGIASAVLRRRSGVTRTARPSSATWLLFQGRDVDGKTAVERELAKLVFGSYAAFTAVGRRAHSASCSSGDDELGRKRQRSPDQNAHGYVHHNLFDAVRENAHRVVLIEGVERLDHDSEAGIKNAIAAGVVQGPGGDVVSLDDAIVVLSCEVFQSSSTPSSPGRPVQRWRRTTSENDGAGENEDHGIEKGHVPRFSLDLNAAAIDGGEGEDQDSSLEDAVDGVFFFHYY